MGPWKLIADPVSDDELLAAKPIPDSFRVVMDHLVVVSTFFGVLPVSRDALLM